MNLEKGGCKIIGDKKFSSKLNNLLILSEKKTSRNKRLQINLALNYGSKSELISAFKSLQKKREKINLSHENADILGFLNHKNVLNIFEKSSIAVACSRWEEPFGRTGLEASANGCAVVITKKGGLPETVTNAKILSKLNVINLEKTLRLLIENHNLRKKLQTLSIKNLRKLT